MSIKTILTATYQLLFGWRKANLVDAVIKLHDQYLKSQDRVKQLEKEINELKEQLEQKKIKDTNKNVNKPSSNHAEWEKGGHQDKDKKKGNEESATRTIPSAPERPGRWSGSQPCRRSR